MVKWFALALVSIAACQSTTSTTSNSGSGSAPVAVDSTAIDDAPVGDGPDDPALKKPPPEETPEPIPDPGKSIADLGAHAAWDVVIDRAQYLLRRKQHGVVYGTLGPAVMVPAPPEPAGSGSGSAAPKPKTGSAAAPMIASTYTWLVDDTDGNGALGIRVELASFTAALGDRVALGGAWTLDDKRRWYWKVDSITKLPALDPAKVEVKDPKPATPGHVVVNGALPQGARTISLARDNDAVYFQLVGPAPTTEGDGWAVADELGNPTAALLVLPGEHASYGGQDMRTADEHWSLRRGVTYWVRIGKVRRKAPDKPMNLNARTAPVRVL